MKETIHSVTGAFAIEPACFYLGYKMRGKTIGKIIIEDVYDAGDPYSFYVGYYEDGSRAFQMRVQAANVTFK